MSSERALRRLAGRVRFFAPIDYARYDLLHRKRTFFSVHFIASLAFGVALAYFGSGWPIASARLGDVVVAVLSYAAIAFGFSLAGLTLAITLPDIAFVTYLARRTTGTPRTREWEAPGSRSNYANLLFVFSWTAVVHWLAIMVAFGLLAARGFDAGFLLTKAGMPAASPAGSVARGFSGLLAGLTLYAVLQFGATVVTLTQVGRVYIAHLVGRAAADAGPT